jgi:hypothetical protein
MPDLLASSRWAKTPLCIVADECRVRGSSDLSNYPIAAGPANTVIHAWPARRERDRGGARPA